jgi:hypothetical protein
MESTNRLFARDLPPALVLLFPGDHPRLWDPEISALVDELEERLDDVFVTHAAERGGPTVADALAAARYAGCSWAVLATPAGSCLARLAPGFPSLPLVTADSRWDAAALSARYEQARGQAEEMAAGG